MTNPNPATPAAPAAATPGSGEQNGNSPSVPSPAPATPAPGNNSEGTVTIPVDEYARLNRQDARARSFDKRVYKKPTPQTPNVDAADPANQAITEANQRAEAAERRAMQMEVRSNVRDLLADDRFKDIPQSTKDLILQSPHMLSSAETLDEAMYEIEDKLVEIAGKSGNQIPSHASTPSQPQPQPQQTHSQPQAQQPAGETPPPVTPGAPAPADSQALEDTSSLRGPARSMAVLRNARKKQWGGVQQ